MQISDTVARGTVKPTYPVLQYSHSRETGGDAIANGFVYRGKTIPALSSKLVFGDITTGRIGTRIVPTCSPPTTASRRPSPRFTRSTRNLRRTGRRDYRARGGKTPALPGMARGVPDPAASTSGLPRTTMASSTS